MRYLLACSLITLMAATSPTIGAIAANDPTAVIAPFVSENTFAVARVDLTGIDFDAMEKWADQVLSRTKVDAADRKDLMRHIHEGKEPVQRWLADFNKAGGKTIWLVFSTEEFLKSVPVFMVVPIEKGADVPALTKLVGGAGNEQHPPTNPTAQVHHALVVWSPESAPFQEIRTQVRPELSKAFAAAGEAKVQVALIPSEDARKVVESMAPPLPGGTPASVLTRGILWAAAAVKPPPEVSVRVVVQSQDAPSAQALEQLLHAFTPRRPSSGTGVWGTERVEASLLAAAADLAHRSHVQNDRVLIDLDDSQAAVVAGHLGEWLRVMRERATLITSASRMRQLLEACYIYANGHKGEMPDSLDQLAKQPGVTAGLFVDPRYPHIHPGYIYIKPTEGAKVPPDRLIIYENARHFDDGVNVGFGDGHVEFVGDEKEFNDLLQQARAAQKQGVGATKPAPSGK